jgi:hypothetical protein
MSRRSTRQCEMLVCLDSRLLTNVKFLLKKFNKAEFDYDVGIRTLLGANKNSVNKSVAVLPTIVYLDSL